MAALTAPRTDFMNKARLGRKIGRPAKSGFTFYNGALVVVEATGYIKPNTGVAGEKVVGVVDLKSHPSVTTSGADGATFLDVIDGIFPFKIGTAGDALAQADVDNYVYAIDDNTVGKTDGGTARPRVGQLVSIESIGGVNNALVAIGSSWALSAPAADGSVPGSFDSVSASGAVSNDTEISELTVAGTKAYTIGAPLFAGQQKTIVCIAASATPVATLTSAGNTNGWTTISGLGALGAAINLVANSNLKWDLAGGLLVTVA